MESHSGVNGNNDNELSSADSLFRKGNTHSEKKDTEIVTVCKIQAIRVTSFRVPKDARKQ